MGKRFLVQYCASKDVVRSTGEFIIIEKDKIPSRLLRNLDRPLACRAAYGKNNIGTLCINAAA